MYRLIKSSLSLVSVAVLLILFSHATASAQTVPGISEPVIFEITPEYPRPNQTVMVKTTSYSTDLDKAVFKWTLNGKAYAQGTGMKEIGVKAGKAGTLTIISVEVSTTNFGVIKNDIAFRPVDVTLLWQSDTYVPPFYKGKALHAYNGSFKVTAIPEFFDATGKRINPKTLVYTWKKNGTVQGSASGFGKDSFVTSQTSYMREGEDISVEVSSPKEALAGANSLTISPVVPEINLYENSPLYGLLYNRALGETMNLRSEEVTLRAEPFFMSMFEPLGGLLSFDWTLNNASLGSFQDKAEITLRKQGTTSGRSDLGLVVQHAKKVLQGASANITIYQ